MRSKKYVTFLLLVVFFSLPVHAGVTTWIGAGFISHDVTIAEENKKYYELTYSPDISSVKMIGPQLEVMLLPFAPLTLGVMLKNQILFPIAYDSSSFRSLYFDFKNRLMLGLSYNHIFSESFGLFIEGGFEYDSYRIAKRNDKNNKLPVEYFRFDNFGLFIEGGVLATIEHGYFKFGYNYEFSLKNKESGMGIVFAGGYRF